MSETKKPNIIGQLGGLITLMMGVAWCITIVGLIWGVPMIIFCKRYIETGEGKGMSSFLGIIFGFFIPGILILLG